MNVNYVNPLIQSTINIFKLYLSKDIIINKNKIYGNINNCTLSDISCMIQISGNLNGFFLLGISNTLTIDLTSNFLEEKIVNINANTIDAIGEIFNIIIGGTKHIFSDTSHLTFKISPPQVILGPNHPLNHNFNFNPVGVLYNIEYSNRKDNFSIEFLIREK